MIASIYAERNDLNPIATGIAEEVKSNSGVNRDAWDGELRNFQHLGRRARKWWICGKMQRASAHHAKRCKKVERRQATPEVSPETLALAKEAYDQVPTIESIEELKDFYTGAKDAGLLSVTVNGKTLNSVITARKSELEKANA